MKYYYTLPLFALLSSPVFAQQAPPSVNYGAELSIYGQQTTGPGSGGGTYTVGGNISFPLSF